MIGVEEYVVPDSIYNTVTKKLCGLMRLRKVVEEVAGEDLRIYVI